MKNNTYCARSDHEVIFRNIEGKVGLCCKMQDGADFLTDQNEKIKNDLKNGIQNPSCKTCWDYEKVNATSWRMQGNEHYAEKSNKYQIELYFDNTCDSACVYCSNVYSSNWAKEIRNTNYDAPLWANKPPAIPTKQEHADFVFNYITNAAKNKKPNDYYEIILLGGEPLLMSINKRELLDLAIESFYKETSEDTPLLIMIQTNANTPDKLMKKCIDKIEYYKQKYKNLKFSISISGESVGKNFEYIRYGSSFLQFVKNFNIWANTKCPINTNMSVNSISLSSMIDYFKLLVDVSHNNNITIEVAANMVYSPEELSVGLLDSRFTKHCDSALEYLNNNARYFSNYNEIVSKINLIKETIGTNTNMDDMQRLKDSILYFENVRKLKLVDVNLELYEYILEKLHITH